MVLDDSLAPAEPVDEEFWPCAVPVKPAEVRPYGSCACRAPRRRRPAATKGRPKIVER